MTFKLQNAYRNPSADTEDIADLLLKTTAGLAVNGDAGVSFLVYHDGTNDVAVASATPLPVSAASLPLPAGAATAANQSTANTTLAAIQAAVELLDNAISGSEIQVDIAGVTLVAGRVPVDGSGVTQPISAVSLPLPTGAATLVEQQSQTTPLTRIAGKYLDFDTGAGTDSAVAIGILLPASGGAVIGGTSTNPIRTDPTGTTTQPVSGTFWQATQPVSIAANVTVVGTGTFTVQAAQSDTWTVQPGNTANTTPWLTNDRPATSGGLTMHKTISAASTNATSVKASAGQVYDIQVFNINAAARYLKLYNKASAPTVGTDTPVKTILIPGNAAGGGVVKNWDKGLEFTLGIAFALTTGVADADTGAVAASEITVNLDYK